MHTLFQLLQESTNSLGFSTALHFQGLMFMERNDEMIKLIMHGFLEQPMGATMATSDNP